MGKLFYIKLRGGKTLAMICQKISRLLIQNNTLKLGAWSGQFDLS